MKNFIYTSDIVDLNDFINKSIKLKGNPYKFSKIGDNKTLGVIFFNPSLRTRLSTQKAAQNLGVKTITMNFNSEGWPIELEDKMVMDQNKSEHIKEAARVMSIYCDFIAVRAFPSLENKKEDLADKVINGFKRYASVPVINMESSTAHPLQALADAITIEENKKNKTPKIVLSWAPHPKALPHAVANSFVDVTKRMDAKLTITHPEGYELNSNITNGIYVTNDQNEAFKNADFIYTKNWSSFNNYGKVLKKDLDWMITKSKMNLTNNAKFMHCLPIRRNVVASDEVIDSNNSLILNQVENRIYSAQSVLKTIIENG